LYDPKTCTWFLRNELTTGMADLTFGFGAPGSGWLPVVGDWASASGTQALAAGGVLASATAPLSQATLQPIVAGAGASSSSLAVMTQPSYVTAPAADAEFARLGSGTQLQAVDPQAVDQMAGLGDLDTPATSTVSAMLPTGIRRNVSVGEIDAIFAQQG
jgi:hypothetical protein